MQTKRIFSLLLAVLMVLTALPMAMFVTATAAESTAAATSTATPGTAPTTLPNGKTYAGTPFLSDSYDLLYDYIVNKQTTATWISGGYVGTGVQAMLQDGAEGIMFKIDTTNATTANKTLAMSIALQIMWDGASKNTYITSTPGRAASFAEAKSSADTKSTWYYSKDGATWTELVATNTSGANMNIPMGNEVTYVYIPMSSFWFKCGETYLKTGTHDKTETIVNWEDGKDMIEDNYWINMSNYYFTGNYTSNITFAQDSGTKISEWRMVDHVQPVAEMSKDLMFKPALTTTATSISWLGGSYYLDSAEASFEKANGLLFEVDTSAVADGTDNLAFAVMMSMNRGDGAFKNAYLLSTFGQANAFGSSYASGSKGDAASDQSSILYWSEDGVNWTAVTGSAANLTMPKSRAKAYVYIPFESFWTRHAEKDIACDSTLSPQRVDKDDMVAALDDGWQFGYIHTYWPSKTTAANAGAIFTNWRFVYAEEDAPKTEAAPTTLPGGSYYTTNKMFNDVAGHYNANYQNGAWPSPYISSTFTNDLNNADGIMFKVDASGVEAGSDTLQMAFDINVKTPSGNTTYLASNLGQATVHNNAVKPSGATSTWYISLNGQTWTSVSGTERYFNTGCSERDEFYVYIPFTSMYTRYGSTYLQGGESVSTENSLTRDQALALIGSFAPVATDRTTFSVRFNSTVMNNASVYDFRFVTKSDTAPAPALPDNLPVVGENLTKDFLVQQVGRPSWNGSSYFKAEAEVNFRNAQGVMFEIDTTNATTADPIQMSFMLALKQTTGGNGGNNYIWATIGRANDYGEAKKATGTSTWYYSEDGENWRAITADSETALMTLPGKHTHAYVYVPMDQFYSRYSEDYITGKDSTVDNTKPRITGDRVQEIIAPDFDFAYIHTHWGADSLSTTASIYNWSFVYGKDVKDNAVENYLPNGSIYAEDSFYTSSFDIMTHYYDKTSVMADGSDKAKTDWQSGGYIAPTATPLVKAGAEGIMFKVDTTNATVASNNLNFTFALQISWSGNSTYILSTARQAGNFAEGTYVSGASSTWYYSRDGFTWDSVTTTSSYNNLPLGKGVSYVYIPMDAFWFKCSETFLKTGAHPATREACISWEDGKDLLPEDWKFNMSCFWFAGDYTDEKATLAQDPNTTISDWTVVSKPGMKSTSATITEDFSYNLYVVESANATDTKMTFTVDGKTVEASGTKQSNGMTKYTLPDLLPQQITAPITMTWTSTVAGETITTSKTESMLDYALKILEDEAQSDWHNLTQAMINYSAAAQKREGSGFTGVSCEAYVKEIEGAVADLSALEGSTTIGCEGDYTKFIGAALRLEGTIEMKITVSSAVASVNYTIGDRSGTATTQTETDANGSTVYYVCIPVYAHEMALTLTIADADVSTDVLTVSVNYYLASAANMGGANTKALIKAIANYGVEAAKMK